MDNVEEALAARPDEIPNRTPGESLHTLICAAPHLHVFFFMLLQSSGQQKTDEDLDWASFSWKIIYICDVLRGF